MAIEKLTENDEQYLDISDDEILEIHNRLVNSFENKLLRYGVKAPWNTRQNQKNLTPAQLLAQITPNELRLIFLFKYRRKLVHKDLISKFVRRYRPDAAFDQQVRHLGTQMHWNILNRAASIPDEEEKVPSGFHYLVSIDQPNPALLFDALKRQGRLAAKDFDELKIVYSNCCATCGRKEGSIDERFNNVEISLQQGHMNPAKSLTLDNTIPQCQYCNQTYGADFVFNEYGRVIAVYNPNVVLRSPKNIQHEMIEILLAERQKQKK